MKEVTTPVDSPIGHRKLGIDDKSLLECIVPTMREEARLYGVKTLPNAKQIALVISALRTHHVLVHAGSYDRSELRPYQDTVTDYWPIESSIGRYFRDAAAEILT